MALKNHEMKLKLVNASYVAEYLAYLVRCDSIHGRYDSTIEA